MDELMQRRVEKLAALRAEGEEHFPYRFDRSHTNQAFLDGFDKLREEQATVRVAGRLMFRNRFGKLMFLRVQDETQRIQWVVSKKEVGEELFNTINKLADIGDLCGVEGTAFETKTGEKSVMVRSFQVLGKNIRPLPEKFHSLRDKETRYRQRELDLIMNRESFDVFRMRSRCLAFVRRWLGERGFEEIEIPYLQTVYGGAEACPFVTHVNAIDTDVFLSISPELFLKRLLVGGFNKVFTLGKCFRNEGIDATHNPEFTSLETYEAFVDYDDVMAMTEALLHDLCIAVHGKAEVEYQGKTLSFALPFRRLPFFEGLEEHAGLKKDATVEEIGAFLKTHDGASGVDLTLPRDRLLLKAFEAAVEDQLEQPAFVIDYPRETSPLCRVHRDDPALIERFELFVGGMELANAYSELNDPIEQRKLLTEQTRLSSQDAEIPPVADEYFMQAIEYGMPPTGGLGIGIDRLIMLLADAASIRDVIPFPFMKYDAPTADEDAPEA